ncbi:MAG: phosphate-starvation-inducible PsiE family protein [Pseudomonadota bacterium]|nr:phosphate-starvation-inducible PsiE family protein [Pseudomonadota bacterium]
MNIETDRIQKIGDNLVKLFDLLALFVIGGTIVWSATYEYISIMADGYAKLKDILLLFIYLELGAMVGIYFRTHRLPVQFLIYIAITALSRHLVIDVQKVSDPFHLYLLLGISVAILILCLAALVLTFSAKKYGGTEEDLPAEIK